MAKNSTTTPTNSHNLIASSTRIVGEIISDEDMRIDGIMEGNISCKGKVIIGGTSQIRGNVSCLNTEVFGTIAGNIISSENLTLRSSSMVNGDIAMKVIEIEPGARVNGSIRMIEE